MEKVEDDRQQRVGVTALQNAPYELCQRTLCLFPVCLSAIIIISGIMWILDSF